MREIKAEASTVYDSNETTHITKVIKEKHA